MQVKAVQAEPTTKDQEEPCEGSTSGSNTKLECQTHEFSNAYIGYFTVFTNGAIPWIRTSRRSPD